MRLFLITLAVIFTSNLAALAQDGDPEIGREIAAEHCIRCHDVAPDGAWKMHPPSFASIAAFRSESQIRARIWFPVSLHSGMSMLASILTPDSVEHVMAYILSLEPEK